jgi:hypothetical protein
MVRGALTGENNRARAPQRHGPAHGSELVRPNFDTRQRCPIHQCPLDSQRYILVHPVIVDDLLDDAGLPRGERHLNCTGLRGPYVDDPAAGHTVDTSRIGRRLRCAHLSAQRRQNFIQIAQAHAGGLCTSTDTGPFCGVFFGQLR